MARTKQEARKIIQQRHEQQQQQQQSTTTDPLQQLSVEQQQLLVEQLVEQEKKRVQAAKGEKLKCALEGVLQGITVPGQFSLGGICGLPNTPGLEIEGVGLVPLPLTQHVCSPSSPSSFILPFSHLSSYFFLHANIFHLSSFIFHPSFNSFTFASLLIFDLVCR